MTDDQAPPRKRLRQTNLLECFALKKEKMQGPSGEMNPTATAGEDAEEEDSLLRARPARSDCSADKSPNQPSGPGCPKGSGESEVDMSQDLFPESASQLEDNASSPDSEGTIIDESEDDVIPPMLNRMPDCGFPLPPLEQKPNHTVFCKLTSTGSIPTPAPEAYVDKWDGEHVRMPCSPRSLYPFDDPGGGMSLKSRWDLIEKSLLSPIHTSYELVNAILQYNSRYVAQWNFRGLHRVFEEELEPSEAKGFFDHLLPRMVALALRLPDLVTQPIPLLKCGKNHSLTFSQLQVACLMCNAFFCTFPRRNTQKSNSEYARYPEINFAPLFSGSGAQERKAEKLKCLINYFRRVTRGEPTGTLTFTRKCLNEPIDWSKDQHRLKGLSTSNAGLIERDGQGMLQVDFANKFVGGGVLGHGCVQEEIRFVISPELIISRLFTEVLGPKEVLVISGAEQFNDTSGYADTFLWEGDFVDDSPRDAWRRRCTDVVAMDALCFHRHAEQYRPCAVKRELNKAYCGFLCSDVPPAHRPAIATGNWGCGVFRGDPLLKVLIQLMAAAAAERDMVYFTFNDRRLCRSIRSMYQFLQQKNATVGDIYHMLEQYHELSTSGAGNGSVRRGLYDFIYGACDSASAS